MINFGTRLLTLWGGQSWPQPPFRPLDPLESGSAGRIARPTKSRKQWLRRHQTIAGLLSVAILAPAQQPQEQNRPLIPSTGAVKFGTNVQLVVVDVTAKDKRGKPIENLTAKDFTITEDGKPQEIKFFKFQRLEEELLPEPSIAPKPAAPPEEKPAAPAVKSLTANQIAPAKPG